MNVSEITGMIVVGLIMLLGLAGAVLPGLPGTPLIFLGALGHKLWFHDHSVSWWIIGLLGLVTVLTLLMDFLATAYGAKKLGATWRGAVGATIGGVLGLLWLPFGLILGPFLGAMLLEMLTGKEWKSAGKAGVGATLGFLAGTVGKGAAALGMIGLWTLLMFWQTWHAP